MDIRVAGICILLGVILGATYGILIIVKKVFRYNIVVINLIDCVYSLCYGLLLLYVLIQYNFGVIRLYLIVVCLLSTYIERKTLGKVFAKIYGWLYNKISKMCNHFTKTKIYKKITK